MNNTKGTAWAYLVARLHERSTYLMLPIIFGVYGIQVGDATYQLISQIGISVSGLLLIILPETNAQRKTTFLSYMAARLREPTTYTTIPIILGLVGIHTSIAVLHQLGEIGVGVGGFLAALLAERGVPPLPIDDPSNSIPLSPVIAPTSSESAVPKSN